MKILMGNTHCALLRRRQTLDLQSKPNDLRLRILGNQEISGKSQNFIELLPSARSSSQNEYFVSTSKNLLKTEIELFA